MPALARDESLLSDALSCASLACEMAPLPLLPEAHSCIGGIYAQGGVLALPAATVVTASTLAPAAASSAATAAGSVSSAAAAATAAAYTAHAVRHYERALALHSQHIPALIGLAKLEVHNRPRRAVAPAASLAALGGAASPSSSSSSMVSSVPSSASSWSGNLVLAYGYLLQALQVDATSHVAWYEMALVLQSQGKASAAAEHFLTALTLERTAPIDDSFRHIRRELSA